jgi:putative ABC transport system permease protein
VSWQNYVDWRDRSTTFETVTAFRSLQMTLTGMGEAERVPARMVTSTLLPMLGIELPLGRHFTATDDSPGAAGVVIVSDGLWRRKFGGQPDVLGRTVQLDKQPYVIVGVLPARFELFQPGSRGSCAQQSHLGAAGDARGSAAGRATGAH